MKYVLYGLPCSGKTTILDSLDIPVINGSTELNRLAQGKFSELSEFEKTNIRIQYTEILSKRNDSFISDGHYSFRDNIVFTDNDGDLYDVFIYLYCNPELISERLKKSDKNKRFADLSTERLNNWQDFEIENLRAECHRRNKDFYVMYDISSEELQNFISRIETGFSSYKLAKDIVKRICSIYSHPCTIHVCDGDKTIIKQDSFRMCSNNYVTHVFDGSFYTGYQSLCFSEEIKDMTYNLLKLNDIQINNEIYDRICTENYVILSSGIKTLWNKLSENLNLKNVIADTNISADTKYYVVKLLKEKGYTITAYGDGKNDLYMLKEADEGILYIGSYLNRSLRKSDTYGVKHIYDNKLTVLSDINDDLQEYIDICKSSSGINGNILAEAHDYLGRKTGTILKEIVPNKNAAVIILERGGRFFGDGLYKTFGGTLYCFNNNSNELPDIQESNIIITDSVINTGKTVLKLISELKTRYPHSNIIIAANVIQEDTVKLLKDYPVFAIRLSNNSFTGERQSNQSNGKGPDTADRLFNYIKNSL